MAPLIALVTGGTGGIGTAICRKLSLQGLQVIAGYHKGGNHEAAKDWQKSQKEAGFNIEIAFGDVSNKDSCGVMISEILETKGPISVLINNAGITRDASFKKMTYAIWKEVISTNLDSVFHATSQVMDGMLNQKYGRIINISSINAQKGQFGQTNYAAAKAGMHGFTKSLAQEVAKHGITVNTVSPGYIKTNMMAKVPEAVLNQIIAQIPVGRLGEPEEIADLIAFLTSPSAAFITGADFSINGGQHMS